MSEEAGEFAVGEGEVGEVEALATLEIPGCGLGEGILIGRCGPEEGEG